MQSTARAQPDCPRLEKWRLILTYVSLVELCRGVTEIRQQLSFHRWRAAYRPSIFPCCHWLDGALQRTLLFTPCLGGLALKTWISNASRAEGDCIILVEDTPQSLHCSSHVLPDRTSAGGHGSPLSSYHPFQLLLLIFFLDLLVGPLFLHLPMHLVLVAPSYWRFPLCHP